MRVIVNQANFVPYEGESLSQETNVDASGYRSIEQQVKSFEMAGVRLQEIRRKGYDIEDPKEFKNMALMSPTSKKGYDMVEAQRDLEGLKGRIKEKITAMKEVKKVEEDAKKKEGE